LFSITIALFLPINFILVLGVYYIFTTAYSFTLKKVVLIDVIMLAMLYTIRIVAGAAAIHVMPSFWLLAFSLFIFHSLAIVKRCTELRHLVAVSKEKVRGRGYDVKDLDTLYIMGIASGYISVMVLALYVNSDTVQKLYSLPEAIWLLCPIMLYWISRVWILVQRDEMDDDPIVFALTDNISRLTVASMGLVFYLAI
jgi:4-hydroxybenzoate polyprenyltransferase